MQAAGRAQVARTEAVYSVVFRTNGEGASFQVMNIVGEPKTTAEIARDLHAAAREMELRDDPAHE
jgi:hypothetical protein